MKSKLTRAVEASGRSRERVAADAGMTVTYLRYLEAGKNSPSLRLARRVAGALGTTVDSIFAQEK